MTIGKYRISSTNESGRQTAAVRVYEEYEEGEVLYGGLRWTLIAEECVRKHNPLSYIRSHPGGWHARSLRAQLKEAEVPPSIIRGICGRPPLRFIAGGGHPSGCFAWRG